MRPIANAVALVVLWGCAAGAAPEARIRAAVRERLGETQAGRVLEYGPDPIRTETLEDGLYRVRFGLERRSVDAAGTPHVAWSEQTWLVRDVPGAEPAIEGIEERRLLSFPGTGPRIVCY